MYFFLLTHHLQHIVQLFTLIHFSWFFSVIRMFRLLNFDLVLYLDFFFIYSLTQGTRVLAKNCTLLNIRNVKKIEMIDYSFAVK